MKKLLFPVVLLLLFSCKPSIHVLDVIEPDITMVFASCSHQDMDQPLWKPIIETHPDVFIWGGDNIYADTDDMQKMKSDYDKVLANPEYKKLASSTKIIGTWDDHDYGKNDAGAEWEAKAGAQQMFLDFLKVPENDIRRKREGVYTSELFETKEGKVKVILLDTRYFRSSLQKSKREGVRYDPWNKGEGGTILGDAQWKWLVEELKDPTPNFTVIVSSIQFLADEHNWEKWGNHPDEIEKMNRVLVNATSKNIFFLSGDRHLAEFSKKELKGLPYPLIDVTVSGMTKTYPDTPEDPNRYREGSQIKQLNFGVIRFYFSSQSVSMEIRGEDNEFYGILSQNY